MAGTPVVHQVADPAAVVQPWPADAEPVPFADLLARPPRMLSGEAVRPCTAGPLGDLPERLHAAVVRADLEDAEALYLQGLERAPCDAGLDAEVLGQLGFLGGLVASSRGAHDAAVARYRDARVWNPQLTWTSWPDSLRQDFDQARVEEPSLRLVVRPAGEVTVDGRALEARLLTPGPHVLRIGDFGAWIEMPPVDDAIVLPGAFTADALGWMGASDPVRRDELAALLGVTLGEGRRALITDGAVTWGGTTGRADWNEIGRIAPVAVVNPEKPVYTGPKKRSPLGPVLLGAGAGVAVIGGALAAQSYFGAKNNLTNGGGWTEAQHSAGKVRYQAGLVVAGVGIAAGGTGLAITVAGAL